MPSGSVAQETGRPAECTATPATNALARLLGAAVVYPRAMLLGAGVLALTSGIALGVGWWQSLAI